MIIYLFEAKHKQHRRYIGLKREESKDHNEPYYPDANQQLARESNSAQTKDISGRDQLSQPIECRADESKGLCRCY